MNTSGIREPNLAVKDRRARSANIEVLFRPRVDHFPSFLKGARL